METSQNPISSGTFVRLERDVTGGQYIVVELEVDVGTGPGAVPAGTYEVRFPALHWEQIA